MDNLREKSKRTLYVERKKSELRSLEQDQIWRVVKIIFIVIALLFVVTVTTSASNNEKQKCAPWTYSCPTSDPDGVALWVGIATLAFVTAIYLFVLPSLYKYIKHGNRQTVTELTTSDKFTQSVVAVCIEIERRMPDILKTYDISKFARSLNDDEKSLIKQKIEPCLRELMFFYIAQELFNTLEADGMNEQEMRENAEVMFEVMIRTLKDGEQVVLLHQYAMTCLLKYDATVEELLAHILADNDISDLPNALTIRLTAFIEAMFEHSAAPMIQNLFPQNIILEKRKAALRVDS